MLGLFVSLYAIYSWVHTENVAAQNIANKVAAPLIAKPIILMSDHFTS